MPEPTYDAWIAEVDREVEAITGMSIHDLEDQPLMAWYRDEMPPREAAELAIEYAGGGDLLVKLRDDYEPGVQARLAAAAFVERMADPDTWSGLEDGDADVLFTMLCNGIAMYVAAWAESGQAPLGLASFVLDADDTDDPNRIHDPQLALCDTLMNLAIESLEDNARSILGLPDVTEVDE